MRDYDESMTVGELIEKLKKAAPDAVVLISKGYIGESELLCDIERIDNASDLDGCNFIVLYPPDYPMSRNMTVSELIERLKKAPVDAEVLLYGGARFDPESDYDEDIYDNIEDIEYKNNILFIYARAFWYAN